MPMFDTAMASHSIAGGQFTFTGARIERLGASEYTLVTIAVDETSSVRSFADELLNALRTAVAACRKSPRAENLLVRVLKFSSTIGGAVELHGFKLLSDIDVAHYAPLTPSGYTPLYDAVYSAIGATNGYARKLYDDDFLANGILFVITDGEENASVATAAMIKAELNQAVQGEHIESLVSVLVGVNAGASRQALEAFQRDAGLTHYIDVADATRQQLAKLAAFVSSSISSQSQSLGTGGPSRNISPTI